MIDKPDSPVLIKQNIGLVAIGIVDQIVKDVHIMGVTFNDCSIRRQEVFFDPLSFAHCLLYPELYRTYLSGNCSYDSRRHVFYSQQTGHFIRGYLIEVTIENKTASECFRVGRVFIYTMKYRVSQQIGLLQQELFRPSDPSGYIRCLKDFCRSKKMTQFNIILKRKRLSVRTDPYPIE